MKIILPLLLISLLFFSCSKKEEVEPVFTFTLEDVQANIIGTWIAVSSKIVYYDNEGKVVHTIEHTSVSENPYVFGPENVNYSIQTPDRQVDYVQPYAVIEVEDHLFLTIDQRFSKRYIHIIPKSNTEMIWQNELINMPYYKDDTNHVSARSVTSVTRRKK
ncbi:hypothetical protein ACMA1I_22960 [Pontibacter sp. 13R65]|uniref:hypothetical protein n=1 Tax=Pontibacter sp. 13R65 TaxID=3127458 RepID=UPI00301E4E2A